MENHKDVINISDLPEFAQTELLDFYEFLRCWGRILTFYYFLPDFVYPSSKVAIPLNFGSGIIIPKCNT